MNRAEIVLKCPACAARVRVRASAHGKRVRCPNPDCGRLIRLPESELDEQSSIPSYVWWLLSFTIGIPVLALAGAGIWFFGLRAPQPPRPADPLPKIPPQAAVPVAPPEMPKAKPQVPMPPLEPELPELPEELKALLTVRDDLVVPIPQDHERQAQRYRDMLAWNQKTLRHAYDQVGMKDPRWDAAARQALDLAARFFSHAVDPAVSLDEVHAATKNAGDAGCEDPLIYYLFARSSYVPNYPGPAELDRRYTHAALALKKSAYPAFRRMNALSKAASHRCTDSQASPQALKEAGEMADAALALVATSAAEDDRNPDLEAHWFEACRSGIEVYRKLAGDHQAGFDRVDKLLAKTPALEALRLKVKGDFFIRYAWHARGSGLANTVTEEGWRKFKERLGQAKEALEQAWKIQPDDPATSTRMITITMALTGSREDMELWFERAIKADGNSREACAAKMDFLDPKWRGTAEELLAFGKACRDTRNWRAGITVLGTEPYVRIAQLRVEHLRPFFRAPAVRETVEAVYDEYLTHHPHDHGRRTEYAIWCHYFGRYGDSNKHFRVLGDNVIRPWWVTEAGLNNIRNWVARHGPGAAKLP
ncbi:MAG: hypothetical protein L0Y71_25085 [Gemmataceae bacterium]|nr:hypothetical protein [Gemmataceae bacterium]